MGKQGLVQFESVALNGRIYFPGPAVDASSQSQRIFQAMAMKPGTTIQDITSSVIIKYDRFLGRLCEEAILQFLSQKF